MNGTTLTESLPDNSEKRKNNYPEHRQSRRLTVKEWQDKYEEHLFFVRRKRARNHIHYMLKNFFLRFPEKIYLEDFKQEDMRGVRWAYTIVLKGFWRWVAKNSNREVRNLWNKTKKGTGLIPEEQLVRLKQVATILVDKLIISLALTAGYKTWELAVLKWEDVDYENNILAIHSRPLDPETKQLLQLRQEFYAGEYVIGLKKNVIQQRLKRLCERNGLPRLTLYRLHKHYEACHLPPLIKVGTGIEVPAEWAD